MTSGATASGSRPVIQTALIAASGSWPGAAMATATPVAPGSSCPDDTAYPRARESDVVRFAGAWRQGRDQRMPRSAAGQRMTHPLPVGEMQARFARRHDGDDHRLVAVADRERGRRAQRICEALQHGLGRLDQAPLDAGGELDEPGRQDVATVGDATHEVMIDEWPQQAVDARTVRAQCRRQLGNREPLRVADQDLESTQAAVERL